MNIKSIKHHTALALAALAIIGTTACNERKFHVDGTIFIDQTKNESQPTEEKIVPTLSDDDVRSRNNRIVIKSIIAAVAIAAVGIAVYVFYHIYLLMI